MIKKALSIIVSVAVILPVRVYAKTYDPLKIDLGGDNTINDTISRIINYFFYAIGLFAFLGILYSGFMYITSAGDAAKAEAAKKNLTWSLIGVALAVFSYVIVRSVATLPSGIK
jgi:hypothetical protein